MFLNKNLPEKFLYEIWKDQKFSKPLTTLDEEKIEILSAGTENKDNDGPDFTNAKIRIGNLTYQGDVEIDVMYGDWKAHGHNMNKKYNRVVLHLFLGSQNRIPHVITQDGRKVPSVSIKNFIQEDLRAAIQKAISSEKAGRVIKMPCLETNKNVLDDDKLDFLYKLGVVRFKSKCAKVLERLKEITYLRELHTHEPVIKYELNDEFYNRKFKANDFINTEAWFQLIYELIFEALGYSKNKDIMLKLAKAIDIEFFMKYKDHKDFILYTEAVLFYVSGIIDTKITPSDEATAEYLRKINEAWNELKLGYDGKMFKETDWKFAKLRPTNFPTIRLAGGARMIHKLINENIIGKMISDFANINEFRELKNQLRNLILIEADGYWKEHYILNQKSKESLKYFVGVARADEIIVNVIFPVIAVYFDMFNKKNLFQKVVKLYANFYQTTENTLVNDVATTLKLNDAWKRSIFYQGMIELFRNYCSKDKCSECVIGRKAFEMEEQISAN
ncbi:MAG: DUF2851 family protein [Syntrophothermus sp.]